MAAQTTSTSGQPAFSNPLLNRFFQSSAERESKANGKRIVKEFYTQQIAASTTFNNYISRNKRWVELLLWAKGSQPMQEFLDYMNVSDANKAWVNIDMTQQRIAAQFVSTLVESMSKNKIYPCVNAIDDGSLNEKEQRMLDALYRMHDQDNINAMQEAAGLQLEPPNAYIPEDEMSAKVYFELEDRLPKEIRFEKMLYKLQQDIKFDRVLNRKGLYDMVTLNLEALKIERIAPMQYTIRKGVPTNMCYNFFMNDTGEAEVDMIGEFYNLKVKDYRSKFGKSAENPNGLTEKEIFELAKLSSMKNIGKFSFQWDTYWGSPTWNQNRPYDDCSILVFDCEINCGEDQYFVSKKDAYGKEDIQAKKGIPYRQTKKDGTVIEQPKPEDAEIIKRQKNTWMRGVYAPYGDKMLYWGRPDLIICPYTEVYKPLSSWSINIPNNDGEYVPSLFERILEPLREYTLTKLKRKQLIAKVKPTGVRIDVESARNVDLGNGDTVDWEEVVRIYDQTGNEIWSSKGLDPLEKTSPAITPGMQNQTVSDIIGLTNVMNSIKAEMRELIGTSVFLEGGDLGERTAAKLAESQLDQAPNVFGFALNGHIQVWEDAFYKVCLLHWNDIVKEEPESQADMLNTKFDITVKMKSTEYEKQILEKDIDRYSQVPDKMGNPSLSLKDAMMIREIDDYKLAHWYLTTTYEANRKKAIEESIMLQQENAKEQQQSLMAKAQEDKKMQQQDLLFQSQLKEAESKNKKEEIALQGFLELRKAGIPLPTEYATLEKDIIQGIHMTSFIENKQTEAAIDQGIQQAEQDNQMAMQQQEQGGMPMQQQQPQQELAMQ